MRFVQFIEKKNKEKHVGVQLENGDVVPLDAIDTSLPKTMLEFLKNSESNFEKTKKLISENKCVVPATDVQLEAPVSDCDKLICIGMNYKDHCAEINVDMPKEPVIFSKFSSTITGPYDDIPYPSETEQLDWEVELVIVIGKEGKNIKESEAMDYVFGYTVAHDVSARDWQFKNGGQFLLGKTMDKFCPLGPAIVTKDSLSDPHNLNLRCRVNGVIKQESNTKELIFGTQALISFISRFITLTPGDIILTGTPGGVGVFRKPPEFLKKGDVVECEIEEIGKLVNKIV